MIWRLVLALFEAFDRLDAALAVLRRGRPVVKLPSITLGDGPIRVEGGGLRFEGGGLLEMGEWASS